MDEIRPIELAEGELSLVSLARIPLDLWMRKHNEGHGEWDLSDEKVRISESVLKLTRRGDARVYVAPTPVVGFELDGDFFPVIMKTVRLTELDGIEDAPEDERPGFLLRAGRKIEEMMAPHRAFFIYSPPTFRTVLPVGYWFMRCAGVPRG